MIGAVLGSPVKHSLSPLLHTSLFSHLRISGNYSAIEVASGELAPFFEDRIEEFDYLSLTMPLKEEALSLPVVIDAIAEKSRSANTLYKRDEVWHLTSTDGLGFISALKSNSINKVNKVLILGAGGTSRAVASALDGKANQISVLGRSSTRREQLESSVSDSQFEYIRWSDNLDFAPYDLVVNTTPAGAADLLADSVKQGVSAVLFDVIYKPWPTVLASRWHDLGGQVINGLELLIYQGIHQLELAINTRLDHQELSHFVRPILQNASK